MLRCTAADVISAKHDVATHFHSISLQTEWLTVGLFSPRDVRLSTDRKFLVSVLEVSRQNIPPLLAKNLVMALESVSVCASSGHTVVNEM